MREDQVENGVKFLVHPKVKTAPLSQRINFLENKGLTSEEISAALSRVEAQGGDNISSGGGGSSAVGGTTAPFPLEPEVPLWKRVAVPGALVLGAVGALGAYQATSRSSALTSSQAVSSSSRQTGQASRGGYSSAGNDLGGAEAANGGYDLTSVGGVRNLHEAAEQEAAINGDGGANGDYAQDSNFPHRLGGDVGFPGMSLDQEGNVVNDNGDIIVPAATVAAAGAGGAGGGDSASGLAGEFRRLSEAMEQQTGQLVEAVGAMKTLASRAEQDSSNLLAARVSSHTSELRAELGTIKQLLLLQSTGGAGGGGGSVENAATTTGIAGAPANSGSTLRASGGAEPTTGTGGGIAAGGVIMRNGRSDLIGSSARSAVGVETTEANGGTDAAIATTIGSTLSEEERTKEDEAAKEATAQAATVRRKDVARAALTSLLSTNAPQASKDGIAMLRMLISNLIKQPNVPRYRRIATSNDNFKKRVLPLEGHRAMMEAIGFKAKGSLWEWTWHEDIGPSTSANNKAVLEDVVAAIDAAARPNGLPPPPGTAPSVPAASSAAVATVSTPVTALPVVNNNLTAPNAVLHYHANRSAAMEANGGGAWKAASAAESVRVASKVVGNSNNGDGRAVENGGGVDGTVSTSSGKGSLFAAAAEVNDVQAGTCVKADASGPSAPPPPSEAGKEIAADSVDSAAVTAAGIRGVPGGDSAAAGGVEGGVGGKPEANGKEEEQRRREGDVGGRWAKEVLPPATMAEVAAAIQRGEEPPGIRQVQDRLSADAPEFALASSPPKPWETESEGFTASAREPVRVCNGAVSNRGDGADRDGGGTGTSGYRVGDDGGRSLHQQPPSPSLPSQLPHQAVSVGP